jgi:putative NADH-flavin reductase
MRIVVFGASRGVGRCLVDRALAAGHDVTAASRNGAAWSTVHHRLRVVRCDVLNIASVDRAIKGHDVVFGTLGADSRGPTSLYSEGARSIVQAMQTHGIRRFVFLSNFGVLGEEAAGLRQQVLLLLARHVLRHTLADHREALDVMQRHAADWVAVRPLAMTNDAGIGHYRTTVNGLPPGGTHIARADVADFLLRQAADNTYLRTVPAIAY